MEAFSLAGFPFLRNVVESRTSPLTNLSSCLSTILSSIPPRKFSHQPPPLLHQFAETQKCWMCRSTDSSLPSQRVLLHDAHHASPWLPSTPSPPEVGQGPWSCLWHSLYFFFFSKIILFSFVFIFNWEGPARTPALCPLCGSLPPLHQEPGPPVLTPVPLFQWLADWKRAAPLFLPNPTIVTAN